MDRLPPLYNEPIPRRRVLVLLGLITLTLNGCTSAERSRVPAIPLEDNQLSLEDFYQDLHDDVTLIGPGCAENGDGPHAINTIRIDNLTNLTIYKSKGVDYSETHPTYTESQAISALRVTGTDHFFTAQWNLPNRAFAGPLPTPGSGAAPSLIYNTIAPKEFYLACNKQVTVQGNHVDWRGAADFLINNKTPITVNGQAYPTTPDANPSKDTYGVVYIVTGIAQTAMPVNPYPVAERT